MTYAAKSLIEAKDFNMLVGNVTTSTVNTLNSILGTGKGSLGYGQTAVQQVFVNNLVTAANEWNLLATKLGQIAAHQGTSVININPPVSGNIIFFSSILKNNLEILYNNRFNTAFQGITQSNTKELVNPWKDKIIFTHIISFQNGDSARYFFNSGGQLKITVNHPDGPGINKILNELTANVGDIFISAPAAGNVLINGNNFAGVTKVKGGGNNPVIDTTRGYYGLSSSNVTVFTQTASTGNLISRNSYIKIALQTNGSQGTNNDNGSVITINTIFKMFPEDEELTGGTVTQVDVVFPETTFLSNSWGNVNISNNIISG
jgi:hypothetical protein